MKTKPITFLLSLSFLFLFSSFVYGEEPEVRRLYYDSGKLKAEAHFKNGKLEGLETVWDHNGRKRYSLRYKNNKKEGMKAIWYESGKKKPTIHYKNDIENGLRKEWDKNGKLVSKKNFVARIEEIK